MADEPSESVAQATQAHECNGAREGSSCSNLSESGAAINDGATEITLFTPQKYMYWHLACIYMYVHALLKEPAPLWRLAACCAPKLDPFTYMVTQ